MISQILTMISMARENSEVVIIYPGTWYSWSELGTVGIWGDWGDLFWGARSKKYPGWHGEVENQWKSPCQIRRWNIWLIIPNNKRVILSHNIYCIYIYIYIHIMASISIPVPYIVTNKHPIYTSNIWELLTTYESHESIWISNPYIYIHV